MSTVFDGTVVIVGGGVAGLVSAQLLQEAGAQVVVIERNETIGGLARSFRYDGFSFDCGPHRFHTENPNVKAYLDRVIQGDGTLFPRRSEVYFQGKYYRWPLHPKNLVQLPKPMAARAGIDLVANTFKEYQIDNFEQYVLRQYGPTLYEHFFRGYSEKFLGIHPRETHPDWAKVGINRAIIDDKLQMQNLAQLVKSTLTQFNKVEIPFLYPTEGMQQAWEKVSAIIEARGGRILSGVGARMEGQNGRVTKVWAGEESFEPSVVIWTAPITLAMSQLGLEVPHLPYLGLLLYNVAVECDIPRRYQWCYYGADDIVFNRISVPRFFSESTVPDATSTGLCVEVTCMEGDARWEHAERLTDWVVDDLVKVGLIPNRRVVHDVWVERIPESYPIYHKHYPRDLEQARRGLATFENLHLAGRTGMFWYNNMDHSIENAMQLCKRLLRDAGRAEIEEETLAAGIA
ncbi:MAG: FAD-dependent oxidoreductase [Alphaproteobacteria bacterium]|nr:FAD-dependent oxidoreductase [Alphaproteobacteria bacterium]